LYAEEEPLALKAAEDVCETRADTELDFIEVKVLELDTEEVSVCLVVPDLDNLADPDVVIEVVDVLELLTEPVCVELTLPDLEPLPEILGDEL